MGFFLETDDFYFCLELKFEPQQHKLDGFAEYCFNHVSVNDLLEKLNSRSMLIADCDLSSAFTKDCEAWKISSRSWYLGIFQAIEHRMFLYTSANKE